MPEGFKLGDQTAGFSFGVQRAVEVADVLARRVRVSLPAPARSPLIQGFRPIQGSSSRPRRIRRQRDVPARLRRTGCRIGRRAWRRAWVEPPLLRAGVHGAWLGQRWNEAIGLRICDLNPLHREGDIRPTGDQPERQRDVHQGGVQTGDRPIGDAGRVISHDFDAARDPASASGGSPGA